MDGTMSMGVFEQRREETMCEAELDHLKKALLPNRERFATPPVGLQDAEES